MRHVSDRAENFSKLRHHEIEKLPVNMFKADVIVLLSLHRRYELPVCPNLLKQYVHNHKLMLFTTWAVSVSFSRFMEMISLHLSALLY